MSYNVFSLIKYLDTKPKFAIVGYMKRRLGRGNGDLKMLNFQVEFFDRNTETDKVIDFGCDRKKAIDAARKQSDQQDGIAYVVAYDQKTGAATGHIAYVYGQRSEIEGIVS